ncbi:hypothetical protein TPAU25S_02646 [Tsukamurella paurometabola]
MSLAELAQWPVENAAGALLRTDDARTVDGYGDLDAEYELASVTKLLVAYGILVAIEEEAIRLDQPVGPPGSTVEHLLAHASGLAFDSDEVVAAPATQRIYSSYGYELVARLVEEETGIGFPDYLREAVFGPLGMTRSSLPGPAGHGARSTVADLTRFAAEVAAPTLLDPRTVGVRARSTSQASPASSPDTANSSRTPGGSASRSRATNARTGREPGTRRAPSGTSGRRGRICGSTPICSSQR